MTSLVFQEQHMAQVATLDYDIITLMNVYTKYSPKWYQLL